MERLRRPFTRLATVATLFMGQFTSPMPPTKEQIASQLNKIDCSEGEPANGLFEYHLIAVFGAGSYPDENGNILPTSDQYARLKAAAVAYTQGLADKIILLDGGEKPTLETSIRYMQDQVRKFSDGKMLLPRNAVFSTTGDINTATNAESLKKFADEKGLKKVLAITDGFHTVRAEMLTCNYGVNSKMRSVEEMGVENSPDYDWYLFFKENFEVQLLRVDPLGKIPTAIKRLTIPSSQP